MIIHVQPTQTMPESCYTQKLGQQNRLVKLQMFSEDLKIQQEFSAPFQIQWVSVLILMRVERTVVWCGRSLILMRVGRTVVVGGRSPVSMLARA